MNNFYSPSAFSASFIVSILFNKMKENAELLTEEGKLLQGVQGDDVGDYDID